ncbi:MAG: hypothetical protein HPY67_08120 [Syntrophaceae bacterium]|nr:hypothetical protein [Syntrophaceae bacterium]
MKRRRGDRWQLPGPR